MIGHYMLNKTVIKRCGVFEVTLAKPFVPDHDLVMNVTIEELNEPHVIFENGDNTKGLHKAFPEFI